MCKNDLKKQTRQQTHKQPRYKNEDQRKTYKPVNSKPDDCYQGLNSQLESAIEEGQAVAARN